MSNIVRYATRPHPDEHRALVAIAVGDDVTVFAGRGRGLHLEAPAFLRALGLAARAATPVTVVELSEDLHRALHGAPVPPSVEKTLAKARAFLAAHPRTLQVAEESAALRARLGDQPVPDLTDGVPVEDLEWAAACGATVVFTDGSADTEAYLSGWAWYVDEARYAAGPVPHLATAFAAERYAAAQALAAVPGPVLLVTDAWELTIGRDVYTAAQGIADDLEATIADRGDQLRTSYVKGHEAALGNLAADQLAGHARQQLLADVAADPDRTREHQAALQRLLEATAEHRAAQRVKHAWFHKRASEIITAEYPTWHDLPANERTYLGRELTHRMRREYNALHPTEADTQQ